MLPSKKKEGRLPIFRSAPLEKQVQIVESVVDDPNEEDKKYFKENFNLTYNN